MSSKVETPSKRRILSNSFGLLNLISINKTILIRFPKLTKQKRDDCALPSHLANTIELCYKESQDSESLEQKLRTIGIEKKKVKLIIERNREKAKKLRKKMSRDFFVPKELVEEFGLY